MDNLSAIIDQGFGGISIKYNLFDCEPCMGYINDRMLEYTLLLLFVILVMFIYFELRFINFRKNVAKVVKKK